RRTGDHVLDVVGVPGAVDVRVVALLGLVLDVRDRDRDAALALLGSLVDLVERRSGVESRVLVVQDLGDGSGQSRLAMVDVTDGADVDVRLGPLELRLSHCGLLLLLSIDSLILLHAEGPAKWPRADRGRLVATTRRGPS